MPAQCTSEPIELHQSVVVPFLKRLLLQGESQNAVRQLNASLEGGDTKQILFVLCIGPSSRQYRESEEILLMARDFKLHLCRVDDRGATKSIGQHKGESH